MVSSRPLGPVSQVQRLVSPASLAAPASLPRPSCPRLPGERDGLQAALQGRQVRRALRPGRHRRRQRLEEEAEQGRGGRQG